MRHRLFPWLLGAVLSVACERDLIRGGEGESCTRRDDCEDGLSCLAQVCTSSPVGDAGTGPAAGLGEPCRARSDCGAGLICSANECVQGSAGVTPGSRYSGRGESCQAKNDCVPELACVLGTCSDVTLAVAHTAKGCHRVECTVEEGCCADFVPNANCDAYRENCEIDPIFCNTYRNLCECNKECVDEVCVAAAPGCSDDAECTSLQTPFCVEGRCRQCNADSTCPGTGTQCVEGVCMAACAIDENCPLLHACQDSACVEVGCRSDRECVFVTSDALALCQDGECKVPCDADTDCASEEERFHVCEQGQCVFVGCESDVECRALLGLESQPGKVRAVCR
jgi:hypothetical protein